MWLRTCSDILRNVKLWHTILQRQSVYLVASDFDQTLSFNDSGHVLSELVGIPGFEEKMAGLAKSNLVQQGAELAYLLRHDPEFRIVRREHLIEAGKRVRLKNNADLLGEFFEKGLDSFSFQFYVISASPQDVVQSALEGIVGADHIFGTQLEYSASTGEISSIKRVSAGYGRIAVLQELETKLQITPDQTPDHTFYIGDGSSDLFVMLHVPLEKNICERRTIPRHSEVRTIKRQK
jgi:2-hydroxy-3-keto-5-methylthiopentenyl-1-phosphate phosphatase